MGINSSKDGGPDDHMSIVDTVIPHRKDKRIGQIVDEMAPRTMSIPSDNIGIADNDIGNIVPNVFKWDHGGRNVYITGTFNNWERQIPMHRSGNDFTYVHNLKKGKHAYKFIVDDEWRFAPDQPTVADIEGRINNFIDVSDFAPYSKYTLVHSMTFI